MARTNKQEIIPEMLLVCAEKGLINEIMLRKTNNGDMGCDTCQMGILKMESGKSKVKGKYKNLKVIKDVKEIIFSFSFSGQRQKNQFGG